MAAKKPHGHYYRICQQYRANEKFSGRGHAAHICKDCHRRGNKPPEVKPEPLQFVDEGSYLYALRGDETYDNLDGYPIPLYEAEPSKPKKKRKPSKEKLIRASQKKQAKGFLQRILADGDIGSIAIHERAAEAGLPKEALHRAKGSLGIVAVATESGSVWRLPKTGSETKTIEPEG
jgi:hypothetical protein